jgi:hypothetical protein
MIIKTLGIKESRKLQPLTFKVLFVQDLNAISFPHKSALQLRTFFNI